MRATLNNINAALKDEGIPGQLVRGKGYFCMTDTGDGLYWAGAYCSSIMVYHLSSWSVERWVREIKSLMEEEQ